MRIAAWLCVVGCGGSAPPTSASRPVEPARAPTDPPGRVTLHTRHVFDDTSLRGEELEREVRSGHLADLTRCYRDHLRKDATARGRLGVEATVLPTGQVAQIKVTGFAAELEACVAARVAAWRFPIPVDADGDPTEAAFAVTFALTPE